MRIAVADNNSRKFTGDIISHWESLGHEVVFNTGASEKLAQWADLYYIDTWDNNIHYLWKLYHGIEGVSRTDPWDNNKKPVIAVRALDWEVWIGFMRDQSMIDWVDKIITIAPHIEERIRNDKDGATGETLRFGDKLKTIKPGVNLDKFTLKKKVTNGKQIGMCLGDMWKYKNHMGGLDIFTSIYRQDNQYRLHVRGQQENSMYDPFNWDYYLDSRGIRDVVTLYGPQADMNAWYENIDILLHPGQKEAFCYAVGEAMAKGIKPVINDFLGSHAIWDKKYLYQTHKQAIDMLSALPFDAGQVAFTGIPSIRQYIKDNYSNERMFKELDEFLEVK